MKIRANPTAPAPVPAAASAPAAPKLSIPPTPTPAPAPAPIPPAPAPKMEMPKQPSVPVSQLPIPAPTKVIAARPADLPAYVDVPGEGIAAGLENSAADGLQLPMLFLAQPLSPDVVQGKMKAGDVFLNSDREVVFGVGQEATFTPFFHYREWIEWASRESGQGIFARSKDPRGDLARRWHQQWADRRRKDVPAAPPESTIQEYHVFFVFFEGSSEPIALPLSRTKHKKGRLLLSLALRRGPRVPLYAGKYVIAPVLETNKRGQSYYNFDFRPAGWASKEEYELSRNAYNLAKEQFDSLSLQFEDKEEVDAEVDGEEKEVGY